MERRRQRPFLSFFLYLSLSRKNNPLTQSSINPIYINFSFPFLCFSPFFFVCVLVFGKEFGWWVFDLIQIGALQLVGCGGNGDLGGGFWWDDFFARHGPLISGRCSSAMEYDSGIPMSVTEGHSSALTPSLREGSLANFGIVYLFLLLFFPFVDYSFLWIPPFILLLISVGFCGVCLSDPFRCANALSDCCLRKFSALPMSCIEFPFRSVVYASVLLVFCWVFSF